MQATMPASGDLPEVATLPPGTSGRHDPFKWRPILDEFGRQRWFVSGVCGSVGRELFNQILNTDPESIIAIDNNESELFLLQDMFRDDRRIKFCMCDLRDRSEIRTLMAGRDLVIHAAACKHVILCEQSPQAAIQTNIVGTQNIIAAAIDHGVERILLTSSDKAVNPTNVMGTSKLMGERLIAAANAQSNSSEQIFAATRFGNVLGSRGSVLPIFKRQIASGGPITITDSGMTRFTMPLSEAVGLVMESVALACGGEVFVTKMPVCRITDLAEVMIEELAPLYGHNHRSVDIKIIGSKPGEKLYEELINEEEIRRTIELEKYYVVKPAFGPNDREITYAYPNQKDNKKPSHPYNSSNAPIMSKNELRDYLHSYDLLEPERVA